jgi:hypothetical protein
MEKQETVNSIDCLVRLLDAITRSRTVDVRLQDDVEQKLLTLVNSL